VRNEEECVCGVCLFRCNIFIGFRIIKEMPGLVGSRTPYTIYEQIRKSSMQESNWEFNSLLRSHQPGTTQNFDVLLIKSSAQKHTLFLVLPTVCEEVTCSFIRCSSVSRDQATGWTARGSGFYSPQRQKLFTSRAGKAAMSKLRPEVYCKRYEQKCMKFDELLFFPY
jgi:hypothetical protein